MEENIKKLITQRQFQRTAALDPRCKVALLIMIGCVSYFLNGEVCSLVLVASFALFVAAGNGAKWAAKMLLFYIVIAYLNALLRYISIPVLSVIMSVFGVTIFEVGSYRNDGIWILHTTQMDVSWYRCNAYGCRRLLQFPLVVMFRYIPTLRIEYRMIRNTMDIRGISDTAWKQIIHPLATIEYILIPLLMRCLKVTDELAASGTTRGLELEEKRYALNSVRFSWKEYAVTALGIVFLALLLFLDYTSIGEIIIWRV